MSKKPSPMRRADGTELRVPIKDFSTETYDNNTDDSLSRDEIKELNSLGEQFLQKEEARRGTKLMAEDTFTKAVLETLPSEYQEQIIFRHSSQPPAFDSSRPHMSQKKIHTSMEAARQAGENPISPGEFMIKAQAKRNKDLQEFVEKDPGHQEIFEALDKAREYQKATRDNQRDNVDKNTIPGVRAQQTKDTPKTVFVKRRKENE